MTDWTERAYEALRAVGRIIGIALLVAIALLGLWEELAVIGFLLSH